MLTRKDGKWASSLPNVVFVAQKAITAIARIRIAC
jgi:hypothetical protein